MPNPTQPRTSGTDTNNAHGPRWPRTDRRQTRRSTAVALRKLRAGLYETVDGTWKVELIEDTPAYWLARSTDGLERADRKLTRVAELIAAIDTEAVA